MSKNAAPDKHKATSNEQHGEHGLVVDEHNRTPLYHQLFLILRSKIHDREYANASYLPSEHKLAETYKVSRITAIRALNELEGQGLVVRERGRGTRVRFVSQGTVVRGPAMSGAAKKAATGNGMVGNFRDVLHEPDEANYQVFSFESLPAQAEVAEALGLRGGTTVYRAVRLGNFEGKPYRYITTYVTAETGEGWTKKTLEQNAVINLLKRAGLVMDRLEESITATLADAVTARRLKVSSGSPLIKVVRTSFDVKGRALEYVIALYRPDRFQYTVSMKRRR